MALASLTPFQLERKLRYLARSPACEPSPAPCTGVWSGTSLETEAPGGPSTASPLLLSPVRRRRFCPLPGAVRMVSSCLGLSWESARPVSRAGVGHVVPAPGLPGPALSSPSAH